MSIEQLRRELAGEDFAEVKKMVVGLAARFHDRWPQNDFDELLAVANEAFVKAYRSYNPAKVGKNGKPAKFSSWVQTKVQWALTDHARKSYKWGREFPISGIDPEALGLSDREVPAEQAIPSPVKDRLRELIDEMSDDAALLALTVLRTRIDRLDELSFADEEQHGLLRSMAAEFGWVAKRFWKAVRELGEALR